MKAEAAAATRPVQALDANPARAREALEATQVTTRSPMGAIVFHSGGLLVDGGWLRILGSGNPALPRSLPSWNLGRTHDAGESPAALLIADDAVGGYFALNGGGLGPDLGKVYYLAPNSLEYESLEVTYTQFIQFCCSGDLGSFYADLRWPTWADDTRALPPDHVFSFYPFLWTAEGSIASSTRAPVPIAEHYQLTLDLRAQLGTA